jgi:Gas vesicle protein
MDRVRADVPSGHRVSSLVDVLDRVLDKGLAIAGDIKISLAEVELLTIRIRLIVCSIDKARRSAWTGGNTTATSRGEPRRCENAGASSPGGRAPGADRAAYCRQPRRRHEASRDETQVGRGQL